MFGMALVALFLFSLIGGLTAQYSFAASMVFIVLSGLVSIFAIVTIIGAILRVALGAPREFPAAATLRRQKLR